jgi:aromatic-L-amino-acid/L-tryptophan decarboxylase
VSSDAAPPGGLEPDAAGRAALAAAALDLLEHRLERREHDPIFQPTSATLIEQMLQPPGEQGATLAELFMRLRAAAQGGWSKAHGGDLAFIPNGGLYSGAIAALLAAGLHAFTGAAFESPALVALEESVLRWLAALFGLPHHAEGLLLSGGSAANQAAIVCARAAGFDAQRSRVYLSERAHHSLHKAMHLSGIAPETIRSVPTDAAWRIDIPALRRQIEVDRQGGSQPWLIVGTAGSTDTGAIDRLGALADVAAEHRAWFHVDAAYGGMFMLTARGAAGLHGIDRADSVTVDAHKGLMLPYGVGALLVRRAGVLAEAHSGSAAYLRDVPEADGLPHYFARGPELTRPFRGMLVWLPLQLHGVAAFRTELDRSLDLAVEAAHRLSALPQLEVLQEPPLSIAVFRARAGAVATDALLAALNATGRLHVSSTELAGSPWIRLAFLHPRTGRAEIDAVLEVVAAQ